MASEGNTYRHAVTAVNSNGESPISNTVTVPLKCYRLNRYVLLTELDGEDLPANGLIGDFCIFHTRFHAFDARARIEIAGGLEIFGREINVEVVVAIEKDCFSRLFHAQRDHRRIKALYVTEDAAGRVARSGRRFGWILRPATAAGTATVTVPPFAKVVTVVRAAALDSFCARSRLA